MAESQHPRDARVPVGDVVTRFHLLADQAARLSAQQDVRGFQEEVLALALQAFECASGTVFLWNEAGDVTRLGPAIGRAVGLPLLDLVQAPAVRKRVLEGQKPLVSADPVEDVGDALGGWGPAAVVPLPGATRTLGVLVLGDRRGDRPFSEVEAAMMGALGSVAGAVFETRVGFTEFRESMSRRMTEAMAELSRASAELERLKTFNEELFESLPVGLVCFDREFAVTFRNSAADRLWPEGRTVREAVRRTDLARIDPDWETALRDVLNMQRPWRAEHVTVTAPGADPGRVHLTCGPLRGGRGVSGGVLVVEDVSEHARMEQRLAVSERLAGLGRLAAMVAHEINNPLDGIQRLVNLARRVAPEGDPEPVERYLNQAAGGLQRLGAIVRELLAFSRSASGHTEAMPIRDLLAEAVHAACEQAREGGVAIDLTCAADLPPLRSTSLFHVVLNLVKNAVEAMPEGGRIDVAARCRPDVLVIEVADDGPGIPEELLPKLFEPFFTRKAVGKGTGLGLVVCRDLVERQGGTLTASNRSRGGAVFTVEIPLAPGACRPAAEG